MMKGKKRTIQDVTSSTLVTDEKLIFDKPIEEDSDIEEVSSDDTEAESKESSDEENNCLRINAEENFVINKNASSVDKLKDSTSENVADIKETNISETAISDDEENAEPGSLWSRRINAINMYNYADSDDTSDEEDLRNTVGNIPMEWYEDFPHIGYDLDGKKIMKPIRNQDELDKFLDKMENPDYWRTIHDRTTARDHVLDEEELQLINRLTKGKFYDPNYNPYEPFVDFFSGETMIHPVSNYPEHKRSFVPSYSEKRKVGILVHAIKLGLIKLKKKVVHEQKEERFYDLWADTKEKTKTRSELKRQEMHIPAPKQSLPGHEASYNPAPEYLPTEEEMAKWKEEDPEFRKLDFIPKQYKTLRKVPQYENFIQERFSRCLDLYLCPRQRKMRVRVNPKDLIPKLPKPSDLKPFPTFQTLCYRGHKSIVLSIAVDMTGQWLASGSKDGVVRVWEIATARCVREITTFPSEASVKCVSWCPNPSVCLLAVAAGENVVIINPFVGDRVVCQSTDKLIESFDESLKEKAEAEDDDEEREVRKSSIAPWNLVSSGAEFLDGQRIIIKHPKDVGKVVWHAKGDYFASTVPGNGHNQVYLHQLTKLRSQNPFSKYKGAVQTIIFHPIRPFFFVATQTMVKVYNLAKQELTKKLYPNVKWISSIAIHPGGDNILVGSYDSKLSWIDLDLSTKPYHTMRYHGRAVRACAFHKKYPLFASVGDDCSIIVSHGMVYNDLLQNALIVPVKVLKGHKSNDVFGIMDVCFHPNQPWVFSAGADATVRLYT